MKRREFIEKLLVLGAASALPTFPMSNSAYAQAQKDNHFLFLIHAKNGLDSTLGLDPYQHTAGTTQKDIFIEYDKSEMLTSKSGVQYGPAMAPLAKHLDDIATIRGVMMKRDAGHESLAQYLFSGVGDGRNSYYSNEYSSVKAGKHSIVVESGEDGSYKGDRSNITLSADEVTSGSDGNSYTSSVFKAKEASSNKVLATSSQFLSKMNSIRPSIQKELEKYEDSDFDESGLGIALAFKYGLSLSAFTSIDAREGDIDSHSNHVGNHLMGQKDVWSQVESIFSLFKSIEYNGSTLFDHTTFVVGTEFSRTPFLNASAGKDHNAYTNSLLLAGKGINADKAFGASHVVRASDSPTGQGMHIASPIDFKTGLVSKDANNPNVNLIYPENVAKTIGSIMGVENEFYDGRLGNSLAIPGVKKS